MSRDTNVQLFAFARPGKQVDEATVTEDSFFATDPGGTVIPASRLVTAPDAGNVQNLVMTLVGGDLYPYVVYTVTATTDISDTEGSTLAVDEQWQFTVLGTAPDPAIGFNEEGGGSGGSESYMSGGFLRDGPTGALVIVAQ